MYSNLKKTTKIDTGKDPVYMKKIYRNKEIIVYVDVDNNFYTNFDNTKCERFTEAINLAYEKIINGD